MKHIGPKVRFDLLEFAFINYLQQPSVDETERFQLR